MSNEPTTTALELEVMPSSHAAAVELSAPEAKAFALYAHFEKPFALAAELLALAKDASTPADARVIRLKLVKARTGIVATKDAAKAGIKLEGDIIQFYHNKAVAKIQEEETRLEEIEKAAERAEAARKEALKTTRIVELAAFGVNGQFFALDAMPDADYAQLVAQSKLAHEAKIAAEKAEAERVAREAAELAERERIKAEAERLAKELAAAELAAKTERERVAKEKAEAEAAAFAEREKIEAAARAAAEVARKEKEAAEAKAAAAMKAAQDAAKKEREAIDAEARKNAEEYEARAKIEREKREALELAERNRIAEEAARAKEAADAAARAAAAPDRDKLAAIGVHITQIQWPEMETEDGKLALRRIKASVATVTEAIRAEYKALGKGAAK